MKKTNLIAIAATLGTVGLVGVVPTSVGAVASSSTETQVQVKVAPIIDLSVEAADDQTTVVKMRGVPGNFVHNEALAKVTTNSRYGYYLYMESANNYTDLKLVGGSGSETSITSITANTLKNGFAGNKWGWFKNGTGTSVDATPFNPIPEKDNPVMLRGGVVSGVEDATTKVVEDPTTVTFGAKIGANLLSGTYANVMRFTAITKYNPSTLADAIYMQDMTPTICSNTTTPAANVAVDDIPMNILRDARDGKFYTVRKLADGNCWMTDNLDLSATVENEQSQVVARVLASTDSDVSANYTMPAATTGSYIFNTATAVDSGTSLGTICPAGWTLPTSTGDATVNGSIDKLSSTYASNLGLFGGAFGVGTWWTKTVADSSNGKTFGFDGSAISVTATAKTTDEPLRCYISGVTGD